MQSIIFFARVTVAVALCFSGWSLAAGVDTDEAALADLAVVADEAPSAIQAVTADEAPSAAQAVTEVPVLGMPLASALLEGYRGGFDVVTNDMRLNGAVTNNSAVNVLSGSNLIAEGSFANASGMSMVVQNSGSNVLIQNATIINVQMK